MEIGLGPNRIYYVNESDNLSKQWVWQSLLVESIWLFISLNRDNLELHSKHSVKNLYCDKPIPEKFALYATAFSRYAPLKVEPLKSDSLISAAVKLALLYQSFRIIMNRGLQIYTLIDSINFYEVTI